MDDIFQHITTKDKLDLVIQRLNSVSQELFSVKKKTKELLSEYFSSEMAEAIFSYFRQKRHDINSQEDFQSFISEFIATAQSMPIVTITLGFPPTDKIAQKVTQWVRTEVNSHHIVAFAMDTSLISGATIGYEGKYKDFSIRKQLDEYFEKNTS